EALVPTAPVWLDYELPQPISSYSRPVPPSAVPATYAAPQGADAAVVQHSYAASPQPAQESQCQSCGAVGPVREVSYNQNIGLLVMRFTRRIGGKMCERCAARYFWQFTLTTLA